MITVDKKITVTISEQDVQSLSDICEIARGYLYDSANKHPTGGGGGGGGGGGVGSFLDSDVTRLKMFIRTIFDRI